MLRFLISRNTSVYKLAANPISGKYDLSHSATIANYKGYITRLRIIGKALKLVGNHEIARSWYDNQPIKALDNKTPKQLVAEGNARAVLIHLEILEDGGYL